jgi:hypothetical protein
MGIIGMWLQTWGPGTNLPEGINLSIAFSGWPDITSALSNSQNIFNTMPSEKYLSLGGGVATGTWTEEILSANLESINNGDVDAYDGVVFDVEISDAAGLYSNFEECFSALKTKGKNVIVTTSHTGPYQFPDALEFMEGCFTSENIDILSPQLYTNGNETSNDYSNGVVPWSAWQTTKINIVPSIVTANLYEDASSWFESNLSINIGGFIQWENI